MNRQAIKAQAKKMITGGNWLTIFLAMLLVTLPTVIVTGSTQAVTFFGTIQETQEIQNFAFVNFGSILNLIVSVITMPLSVALIGYVLDFIRKGKFEKSWKDIFTIGFKNFGKFFSVQFLMGIKIMLWSFLFIIPGIIKSYEYYFATYIINDNPKLSANEAMQISSKMTKGYKSELFILDLSFIPWVLLMVITGGIAGVYFAPYVSTVAALYYQNFKIRAIDSGVVDIAEFGDPQNAAYPYGQPAQDGTTAAEQNAWQSIPEAPMAQSVMDYTESATATPVQVEEESTVVLGEDELNQ